MPGLDLGPPKSSSSAPGFIIAAVLLLAIAGAVTYRVIHRVAHLSIPHAAVFPVHTEFSSGSIELRHQSEDDLYVLVSLHIQNDNTIPVFIKTYNATLTDSTGAQRTTQALSAEDVTTVLKTFPKMRPLATSPLPLDTTINPGASADGMVLLQFPITKDEWDHRQSATLTIGFYHQSPVTLTIP